MNNEKAITMKEILERHKLLKGEQLMNNTTQMVTQLGNAVPLIHDSVYVDPSARIIGSASIAEGVSIWPMAVIRADSSYITIGRHAAILDCAFVESPEGYPVVIEAEALISHGAIIHGACIESHSLVGIGAIVLDGALISSGSIIAAGSFIPAGARIPPNSLVMGTPGRVIREVKPGELANTKKQIELVYQKSRKYMYFWQERLANGN
jgi:carbonic anhydrase/acetyltransferase-like protein (isoleucine patch superfamily)